MRSLLAIVLLLATAVTAAHADVATETRDAPVARPTAQPDSATPDATPQPVVKPVAPRRDRITATRSANADCMWTGKRTIQVLTRDDLIAADGFLKFYNTFGCPVRHLSAAFACTVDGLGETDAKALEARIEACWADPSAQPDATAAPVDEGTPVPKGTPPAPRSEPGATAPRQ